MFEENEKLYYIDIKDGIIHTGKFIESNRDGIWIKLQGHSMNTFVFSDDAVERVFKEFNEAESGLQNIKDKLRDRLSKGDNFIKDILERLKKSEGELYLSIIKEILYDKSNMETIM